jgi:hypothetical protein
MRISININNFNEKKERKEVVEVEVVRNEEVRRRGENKKKEI